VDRITGYHTDSLLCMPVKNAYDEVIAVAQVINKNPDIDNGQFTKKDEQVAQPVSQTRTLFSVLLRKEFNKEK
jgi:dual 3',5'-cyclic-AMP and -GMP phosphodiesterase 11